MFNSSLADQLKGIGTNPINFKPTNSRPRHIRCGKYMTECTCEVVDNRVVDPISNVVRSVDAQGRIARRIVKAK